MTLDPAALRSRDIETAEKALPAHMMFLMMEECQKKGIEMRPDIMHKLNVAAAAPLASLDTLSVARVAKRIDDTARSLLNDLSPDDPRHGLYCCAMLCLVLVDEGYWQDRMNQAVLVSLMLMSDAEDDSRDADGNDPVWGYNTTLWKAEAKKLLTRAIFLGFYHR